VRVGPIGLPLFGYRSGNSRNLIANTGRGELPGPSWFHFEESSRRVVPRRWHLRRDQRATSLHTLQLSRLRPQRGTGAREGLYSTDVRLTLQYATSVKTYAVASIPEAAHSSSRASRKSWGASGSPRTRATLRAIRHSRPTRTRSNRVKLRR
jgi:hypothetical protein